MTISLVDPRVSRDGIPLCPHHADATTPPVGWTMNDLRSENRAPLAPVRSLGPRADSADSGATTSERSPRNQGALRGRDPERGEASLFRRTAPSDEAAAPPGDGAPRSHPDPHPDDAGSISAPSQPTEARQARRVGDDPLRFSVSRQMRTMPVTAHTDDEVDAHRRSPGGSDTPDQAVDRDPEIYRRQSTGRAERTGGGLERRPEQDEGSSPGQRDRTGAAPPAESGTRVRRNPPPTPPMAPASRPTKRRDAEAEAEELADEEELVDEAEDSDRFPWHHHFEDDEPVELKAKSPLLSRAFRSSVG